MVVLVIAVQLRIAIVVIAVIMAILEVEGNTGNICCNSGDSGNNSRSSNGCYDRDNF